jgi:hypothetical protein
MAGAVALEGIFDPFHEGTAETGEPLAKRAAGGPMLETRLAEVTEGVVHVFPGAGRVMSRSRALESFEWGMVNRVRWP